MKPAILEYDQSLVRGAGGVPRPLLHETGAMGKKNDDDDDDDNGDSDYKRELRALQIELVKLQRTLIQDNARVLVIIEGRDGAGKDGTIKRLTAHMSPRDSRLRAVQAVRQGKHAVVLPALHPAIAVGG